MKKNHLIIPGLVLIMALVIFACKKKDESGTSPGFKEETGTGLNPFPNNPTVTGTPTSTNPATQNSQIVVGTTGWSNLSCLSTNRLALKSVNGQIDVTLNFVSPPQTGTYAIGPIPTPSMVCSMQVNNAPNQPAGTVWVGKSGLISVTSTSSAVNATIVTNVICTQQTFNFPQVSVSGVMGCN